MEERCLLIGSRRDQEDARFTKTVNGRVRPVVDTICVRIGIGTEQGVDGAHDIRRASIFNRKSGGKTAALQIISVRAARYCGSGLGGCGLARLAGVFPV